MNVVETGFQLNEHEKRRLEALKSLLLKTGSDVKKLGARLDSNLPVGGSEPRVRRQCAMTAGGIDRVGQGSSGQPHLHGHE
ncbi:MAG: hypothetical protein AMXMBFR13_43120 [Phycisphaerae bacterium]